MTAQLLPTDLTLSSARILDSAGEPVGTGILVGERQRFLGE